MNNLKLQVVLSAVDKMTAPFKNASKEVSQLSNTLKKTQSELKNFEKTQSQMSSFSKMKENLSKSNQLLGIQHKKIEDLRKARDKFKNDRHDITAKLKASEIAFKRLQSEQSIALNTGASNLSKINAELFKEKNNLMDLNKQYEQIKDKIQKHNTKIREQKVVIKNTRKERIKEYLAIRKARQELSKAGINIKNMAIKESELKENISRTTNEIDKQRRALEKLNQKQILNQKYRQKVEKLKSFSERTQHIGQRSMMGGAAIAGVGYAAGRGIIGMAKTAAQFEQFQKVLETTEGSEEKAKTSMNWISDFATKTPYELNEVTESFVRLRAYGMDPTNGLLKTLGDTSSAMGKPIMQAVEAIADAVTGENERLKEFGIKGSAIKGTNFIEYAYTDRNGKQRTAKVDKNNRKQIEETLKKIWNEKYADAMEKQSNTLIGIWSNLQDQWVRFQNMIMQSGAFDVLKGKLKNVLDTINKMAESGELKQWAEEIGETISTVVNGIWSALVIIAKIAKSIGQWIIKNKEITVTLIKWGTVLGTVLVAFGAFSSLLSFIAYPLMRLGLGFAKITGLTGLLAKTNLKGVRALISWKTGLPIFKNLFLAIKNFGISSLRFLVMLWNPMKYLKFGMGALRAILFGLRIAVMGLFSPLGLIIAAIVTGALLVYKYWDYIKAFFSGFFDGFITAAQPILSAFSPLQPLFESVGNYIKIAYDWVMSLFAPTQSTAKELETAASWGKKFGEWLGASLDLVLLPLTTIINGMTWIIENIKNLSFDNISNGLSNAWDNFAGKFSNVWDKTKAIVSGDSSENVSNTQTLKPHWSGGYVGNGGKYQPMGIVHGGEYVMTKEATSKIGLPLLNALNYGKQATIATALGMSVATAQPFTIDQRQPIANKAISTPATSSMQVTININASAGQNAQDIAMEVKKAILRLEQEKQARSRASLYDRD